MDAEQRANTPCYIGRITKASKENPVIGAVVCVIVDDGMDPAETDIVKWVKAGLAVEIVPVWWVRLYFGTTERYSEGDAPPVVGKAA